MKSLVRIDTMKRLALVLVFAAAALLPAAAPAAGCRPLDCAPSGVPLGHGLLAARPNGATGAVTVVDLRTGTVKWSLPTGVLTGTTLVHQDNYDLTWYDALTGKQTATATIAAHNIPSLLGTSQDGKRAVLVIRVKKRSTFLIVSPVAQKVVDLPTTDWDFDALADSNLYLLRYLQNGYQVRRYDLATNTLAARPLKDPHESSTIWGTPWARVASADGRYLFTLYVGSNGGSMVHELDLRTASARCIDLPGTGDFNSATSYALELSHDGRTLWAASPGYGRVVAIDVRGAKVKLAFRFHRGAYTEAPTASVSALSPDGARLAVAVGNELWFFSTVRRTVVKTKPSTPLALAFSPDGSTLWAVLTGDRVVALPIG
jgi:DNA-binding beta-propeller fold protein YncE